jgi:hypothetical protein
VDYKLRRSLLYETWADRPGVYIDILYLKCKEEEEEEEEKENKFKQNVKKQKRIKMYYLTQIRTVTCYTIDPSS